MAHAAADLARIFAANRAVGAVALAVRSSGGMTRRARLREEGSLRVRCPGPASAELEAVIVNTAGGVAGGDRLKLDVSVEGGARLAVTTAAAEKIYRALEEAATIDVKLSVAAGACLAWLPQETILFDRARLERSIDIELAADVSAKLAQGAVAKGGTAVATVLVMPGDEATAGSVRALADQLRGEVGASAWNGLAVVRLCADGGEALRHDLIAVLTAVRGAALPRLWLN